MAGRSVNPSCSLLALPPPPKSTPMQQPHTPLSMEIRNSYIEDFRLYSDAGLLTITQAVVCSAACRLEYHPHRALALKLLPVICYSFQTFFFFLLLLSLPNLCTVSRVSPHLLASLC